MSLHPNTANYTRQYLHTPGCMIYILGCNVYTPLHPYGL